MKRIKNINDRYNVLEDWDKVKDLMAEVESEFLKFYGPKKMKRSGVRARKKVICIIKDLLTIRKNIMKQRQDYDSEY